MSKSYKEITEGLNPYLAEVKKGVPEVMKGFSAMAKAATADGALDKKTKELLALAIGIATRCDGCIGFHAKALVHLGLRYVCIHGWRPLVHVRGRRSACFR